MPTLPWEALQLKRDQIKTQLSQIGDMRPGSLVERYRRCGKPSCHCTQEGHRGHGPLYSLTHAIRGKTVTHIIPRGPAVERTLTQVAEYRRFRDLVRQLVAVSEQICQAQLPSRLTSRQPEDKKNGARRSAGQRGGRRD